MTNHIEVLKNKSINCKSVRHNKGKKKQTDRHMDAQRHGMAKAHLTLWVRSTIKAGIFSILKRITNISLSSTQVNKLLEPYEGDM